MPEYIFFDHWKVVEQNVINKFKQFQKERNDEIQKKEDEKEYKQFLKLKKKYANKTTSNVQ